MTATISTPATTSPAQPDPAVARLDWRVRYLMLAVIWRLSLAFIKIGDQALAGRGEGLTRHNPGLVPGVRPVGPSCGHHRQAAAEQP